MKSHPMSCAYVYMYTYIPWLSLPYLCFQDKQSLASPLMLLTMYQVPHKWHPSLEE